MCVASGGKLRNFIVKTTLDAEIAINFLRQNKIGKASFFSLDKIRDHNEEWKNFICPEWTIRIFDLLKI